jgi:hypothetical protein
MGYPSDYLGISLASLDWHVMAHLPKRGGDVMVLDLYYVAYFISNLFSNCFQDHITILLCDDT